MPVYDLEGNSGAPPARTLAQDPPTSVETNAGGVVEVRTEGDSTRLVEVTPADNARVVEVRVEHDGTRVVEVIEPIYISPAAAGIRLDDLADVDAPPATAGLLERQDDGRVRPVTRDAVLAPHINAPTPHPAYDDTLDLTLIFNNGLV